MALLDDVIFRIGFYLLQCVLQVMELDIHLRDARQLLVCPVENLFADNHHVCFLHSDADVVAGEVFRAEGQLLHVFGAPVLRRRQKVLDEVLAFVKGRHIDENLSLESAKESLVDFPAKKVFLGKIA